MVDAEPPAGTPPPEDRPPLEPLRQIDHGRVLVDRAVLEVVRAHVASDATVEHGGILVGHVDDAAGITIVIDAIRGVGTVTRSASLTFTHETWDHVNNVMAEKYPDAKMVGWYHSHPGFGIFLSDYDQFIHRNFFLERWQVAYVDDPVLDRWGFFGWDGDELVRFGRWGTWSSDEGDGPMVAHPPPVTAPEEPGGPVVPPPPPGPPAAPAGPVLTVEPDPERPSGIRGWLLGAGIFVTIALVAFGASSLFGGDDPEPAAEDASSDVRDVTDSSTTVPTSSTPPATTQPTEDAGEAVSVLILNASEGADGNCAGTGTSDLLASVPNLLLAEPVNGSPVQEDSSIDYRSPEDQEKAQEIGETLGVSDVEELGDLPEGTDIVVRIGTVDVDRLSGEREITEGCVDPGA